MQEEFILRQVKRSWDESKKVDAAIELIQHKVPSIACGYSDELAYLCNKNFPAFLAELEKLKNAV